MANRKIWIPVFLWREGKKKRYEIHGVYDFLVSDKKKRIELEGDMWSEFLFDADTCPEKKRATLHWVSLERGEVERIRPSSTGTSVEADEWA